MMKPSITRRQFLAQGSTLVAAGIATVHFRAAGASPNSKLALGYVGTANRAAANLAETSALTDAVEVTALADVDDRFLAVAQGKHPGARTYHDFREMIDREKLDAVVVATPDHTHAVAAAAALRRGWHVYCEKPLTRTVSECRAIRRLAAEKGVQTQLGTQIHAGGNYRRVVELIQSGAIGAVREVHVWCGATYGGKDAPTDRPPVPKGLDWNLWLGPVPFLPYSPEYVPGVWRNWWAFGGGTVADFGCHFMDLPHWALDLRAPLSVEVVDGPPVHPDSTPPWLILRYQHPERKKAGRILPPVTLRWYHGGRQPELLDAEQKQYFRSGVLFVGEDGNLLADYTRRQLLPEARFADFKAPAPFIPDSVGHHREWIDAIRNGGTTTCNFDYSGALTESALLGNVAYRTGRRIDWDSAALRARDCPEADAFIQHRYRDGWVL